MSPRRFPAGSWSRLVQRRSQRTDASSQLSAMAVDAAEEHPDDVVSSARLETFADGVLSTGSTRPPAGPDSSLRACPSLTSVPLAPPITVQITCTSAYIWGPPLEQETPMAEHPNAALVRQAQDSLNSGDM